MTRWVLILLLVGCGAKESGDSPAEGAAASGASTDLRPADADRGAVVYETCASCHALVADADEAYFGPHLAGLFGRPLAADENFDYTEALRTRGGVWTEDRLARYLRAPRDFAPGTSMIQRLRDEQDVVDVVAYLRRELAAE